MNNIRFTRDTTLDKKYQNRFILLANSALLLFIFIMSKYKHGRKIVLLYYFCIVLFILSALLYLFRGIFEPNIWFGKNIVNISKGNGKPDKELSLKILFSFVCILSYVINYIIMYVAVFDIAKIEVLLFNR